MIKSTLRLDISIIKTSDHTNFDILRSHNKIFGDLNILVDENILPGSERLSNGEFDVSLVIPTLMSLRQINEPNTKIEAEFIPLSGYIYIFEYVVENDADILNLSVVHDEKVLSEYDSIKLDLKQVQLELNRFRGQMLDLLFANIPKEKAIMWWEANAFEEFDDSENRQGLYR